MSIQPIFKHHEKPEITHFLRRHQILEATGFSQTTLWRLMHNGQFPVQVQLGPNSFGWRVRDYELWAADPQGWGNRDTE